MILSLSLSAVVHTIIVIKIGIGVDACMQCNKADWVDTTAQPLVVLEGQEKYLSSSVYERRQLDVNFGGGLVMD